MRNTPLAVLVSAAFLAPLPALAAYATLDGSAPLVIAHRGGSGCLPEHALQGYKEAIKMGANCIEPDLVMTKDDVLIVRHEPMLGSTSDVARTFSPSRMSTKLVDGVAITDYFASHFTPAEIKTVRAIQGPTVWTAPAMAC